MDVNIVAKAIIFLRKQAGYTQRELADRLGVSDKAVSKWERGLGLPDISLLNRLSVLLDTDVDSLLAGNVIHHEHGWHGLLILDDSGDGVDADTIIYDKPLIYYLLSYFILVGIKHIKIVCSQKNKSYICHELVDEECFEFTITFADSVKDVIQDLEYLKCDNMMVLFGRSLIYGVDMTRFLQKAMSSKQNLTLMALPRGRKKSTTYIRFDANKKIVPEYHNDQLKTQYNYCDIPLLFCPKTVFLKLCPDTCGQYDIAWIFRNQDVFIEVLDRGFVEIQINNPDNVLEASQFVKVVQEHCGMVLYCIEEVSWRRGVITLQNMKKRAAIKQRAGYGEYVQQIIDEYSNEK